MEIRLASVLRRGNSRGRRLKTEKLRFVSTECMRSCVTNQNSTRRSIDLNDFMQYNEREDS
jgi:hypothetical protein